MKKVVFIRHAKSSWDEPSLRDLDRPLNSRGLLDAPKMANYLLQSENLKNLAIISSSAKRARQTAFYFAEAFDIKPDEILTDEQLYFGDALDYIKAFYGLDDKFKSCLIFGHNPNIEHLVAQFSNPYLGHAPTCSMFICETSLNLWNAIQAKDFILMKHVYPKMI
ncbi:MAG: histidine phosphatase family protein [Saprospiraceae bacterium]|nr:histidine phosphatase family protein [Saprospiraceae bacterium]